MAAPLANEPGLFSALRNAVSHADADDISIHGTVLLQKKNVLDFNSPLAEIGDNLSELVGKNVKMALVSSVHKASGSVEGRRSKTTHLEDWLETNEGRIFVDDDGVSYPVVFSVDEDFGAPGALLVESQHTEEFFLRSVTLKLPSGSSNTLHFICNSWVHNKSHYHGPRIFFSNKPYLPSLTPLGLQGLRTLELTNLRGDEAQAKQQREAYDRIYDYDVYNDLGNPDENEDLKRPVLGGSKEYPYPRRCRTGRNATKTDPKSEQPTGALEDVYVPRDEQFGHIKRSDFLGVSLKSFAHFFVPLIEDLFEDENFESMADIADLYTKGMDLSNAEQRVSSKEKQARYKDPLELIQELTDSPDDPSIIKFPTPDIIKVKQNTFVPDEEFARETVSGLNPMTIERLKTFPPKSSLDASKFGPQPSSITKEHIMEYLDGLTVDQALAQKRLYIVDYHDVYLPYLERINALQGKGYASRSLFFLRSDGTLMPIAIELTLPPTSSSSLSGDDGNQVAAKKGRASSYHRVFTPSTPNRVEWELAKAHANINDAGFHQLVSHWLRTHCALEPFIIAMYRNLSALHPLHVLLKPHCKNTMNINAIARKTLINCDTKNPAGIIGGIIEKSFTSTKYSMEMSSIAYKTWRFDQQGLPQDLIKRGMAEEDPETKELKLTIPDYPFAVDGLEIWGALEQWVDAYVSHYYTDNVAVTGDVELQAWWKEIREVGHADKKDEAWWPALQTRAELREVLTSFIWLASAHHAAVNFGQYAYAGYMPNKPTMGRKLIPEPGTAAYEEMTRSPEQFLLKMASSKSQATIVMATLEILSTHSSDESYLGHRATAEWTADEAIKESFAKFGERLAEVEKEITARNADPKLKNRYGAVQIPYTLLVPASDAGLTGRGIPNSTSI